MHEGKGNKYFHFPVPVCNLGDKHILSKESKTGKDNLNLPWSKLRRKWPSLGGSGQDNERLSSETWYLGLRSTAQKCQLELRLMPLT